MKKVWSNLAIYVVKGDSAKLHLGYIIYYYILHYYILFIYYIVLIYLKKILYIKDNLFRPVEGLLYFFK